jgi:hypothetical protein
VSRLLLTAGNVIGFQLVWLASIGGAGAGLAWAGPAAAAVFVAAMLAVGGRRRDDLRMLAIALPLGLAMDSGFAASGWLVYAEPGPWPALAPVWIASLWAGFALTLNHSMAFLRGRPAAAALFGLLGGPLAYWSAAEAFSAVAFGVPAAWALAALAIGWAAVLPLLFALGGRGRADTRPALAVRKAAT